MRHIITFCLLLVAFSGIGQHFKKQKDQGNTRSVQTSFEKGALKDGRPIGVWEYFDSKGVLDLKMDYDSSRIVYSRPDTARYLLQIGDKWQRVQPARAPHIMGSQAKRLQDLSRALRYPISALQQRREGVVSISYTVNEQGQATNYLIEQSTAKEFDQAVWQAIKDETIQWIPAIYLGRPRAAKFYLSAVFRITSRGQAEAEQAEYTPPKEPMPPYVSQLVIIAFAE